MGYTHYWRQEAGPIPDDAWAAITADFRQLLADPSCPPVAHEDDKPGTPPDITGERIRFNGIASRGHETFVLERVGRGFSFCKTAAKPYDKLVVATLAIAKLHAGDLIGVSSDGGEDDWGEGLAWASRVLGRDVPDPVNRQRD